jgi:tetratricopeptide (TPR) repeat protein
VLVAGCLLTVCVAAEAQGQLAIRRQLAGVSTGCQREAPRTATNTGGNNPTVLAEARRFVALGHEAALVGEHRTARDAFSQAAALTPDDESIAFHLARAHEALGDTASAVREYCRYARLAPGASDAAAVRDRITALSASRAGPNGERARAVFGFALAHYDALQFQAAADSFSSVIRLIPTEPEPVFNRAMSYLAMSRRAEATRDLEAYLRLRPDAQDAPAVRQQISALLRPEKSVAAAVALSVIPGAGQVYAGSKVRGAITLLLVGGGAWLALKETSVPAPCPAGTPPPCFRAKQRPNVPEGLYVISGVIGLSMIDAALTAARKK